MAGPIIIVFGVPYLICMGIFSYGKEDARRSLELGFVPGVLPPGMTESDYLTLDTPQKKEVESLWKRGVLASPAVLLPVGGQIGDGIATWIGIDYFCLLYTSPSPRDMTGSRMPSSA